MTRNSLNLTHHDPNHPKAGKVIEFDDFLGIDSRGSGTFGGLRQIVANKNMDEFGENCGIGLLSVKHGRVDLHS